MVCFLGFLVVIKMLFLFVFFWVVGCFLFPLKARSVLKFFGYMLTLLKTL